MRVLIAGIGSAIGTSTARVIARHSEVSAIAGFDLEPPRRYIADVDFSFAEPANAERVDEIVARFKPTVVVHAWVFEPLARSSPGEARTRTLTGTEALLGACARIDTVERFVARSSVSIYGRGRTTPECPTVETAVRPTTTFGRIAARVEDRVAAVADSLGADSRMVRLAPVMASNLYNPLGRYLRLPAVPVPITTKRFGVVHLGDAARTMAAAAAGTDDHEGGDGSAVYNVMAAEPVTAVQAVTIGGRPALPVLPFAFRAGRLLGEIPGRPIPEHVAELLSLGGLVEPTDVGAELGVTMRRNTPETILDVYSAGELIDIDVDRLIAKAG